MQGSHDCRTAGVAARMCIVMTISVPALLHGNALLSLEYSLQRQVREGGAELIHLTLEYRDIALERSGVGKDGREAATECAETIGTANTVPGDSEYSVDVVLVDGPFARSRRRGTTCVRPGGPLRSPQFARASRTS
jgi:hypothetical protein